MVEATNNFIFELLRRIQANVSDLKADVGEILDRVGHIEPRMADRLNHMDRQDEQIERLMRRLELTEASH